MTDIKEVLLLWFIIFLIKNPQVVIILRPLLRILLIIMILKNLAEELHKPFLKKFKKRKLYSGFKDNIWGTDLAD